MRPDEFGLEPLPIPVPEGLEAALGYEGDARYLGMWWEPARDEAMVSDGVVTCDGYWDAFVTYVSHPRVWPHLEGYHLGNSDSPARHALLLDLAERRAWVGPIGLVEWFLREDACAQGRVRVLPEGSLQGEMERLLREAPRRSLEMDPEEVRRRAEEMARRHAEAMARLRLALDSLMGRP